MKRTAILAALFCAALTTTGCLETLKPWAAKAKDELGPIINKAANARAEQNGYTKIGTNAFVRVDAYDGANAPLTNGVYFVKTIQVRETIIGKPEPEAPSTPVPPIDAEATNAPPEQPDPISTNAPPPQPPPADPQPLRSAKWAGFPKLTFDCPSLAHWPKQTGSNGKTVQGILRVNGKKVEWVGAGRDWVTVHNATVPGGKYYQSIPSGTQVPITLTDINGKNETNPILLTWP